ncbi:hypothetical protein PYW08_006186 [Mythimna loreyi]|uniref:Uncharacterized protein n=1 Tax=Mythimna loreyi TaxID=667449 RepID=A0ACC2QP19_9NEOP|nr:hypothetical protein PYW08_006186 [Mythimna loreyi]
MCNKMISILFFCLILSILRVCVSDPGYECKLASNPKIFLVKDEMWNFFQEELNSKFFSLCERYYTVSTGSLKESRSYDNVIQFAVKDYYDGQPLQNFVYAGNISKIDNFVCQIEKDEGIPKCNEMANLVSKPLEKMDGGNIYDFVQKMDIIIYDPLYFDFEIKHRESCNAYYKNTKDLSTVLFCYKNDDGSSEKRVSIPPLTLLQVKSDECQQFLYEYKDRLLAVLAPEPVELPFEYQVPTIFYEAPYMSSETKSAFPNSMNLVPWRLLKHGFVKFIKEVGWQRVAIVTDDSEYSIDFENELTTLFSKEGLVYTVIRCEDAKCDMEKIVQELREIFANIVVANVEKNNAEKLLKHSFVWLVRQTTGKLNRKNSRAFSFSLHSTQYKECTDADDNILTGLNSIKQAYNTVNKDNIQKKEFYRLFAEKLEEITPRITEAVVNVYRSDKLISIMSVKESGAKIVSYNDPYGSGAVEADGTGHCLVTTYDFYHPCEDPLIMFFMFTLMMFVLTILLITCYFDKTAPLNDVRYQNFR